MTSLPPLRGAAEPPLSFYLTQTWWGFNAIAGRANSLRQFVAAAHAAGVSDVIHQQAGLTVRWIEAEAAQTGESIFTELGKQSARDGSFQKMMAQMTIDSASSASKLAIAVLVHAGFETFLLGMCRLGVIFNRNQALSWIADRKVALSTLATKPADEIADDALERWLTEQERESLLTKWDRLISLIGFPPNLISPPNWHFDKAMLEAFDVARHGAVHHGGAKLAAFDLDHFCAQAYRAATVITAYVAKKNKIFLDPRAMGSSASTPPPHPARTDSGKGG